MAIQAFLDDSGGGVDPVFVFGGYVAEAERWFYFTAEWQKWLDFHPRIQYFKMYEANQLCGEFSGVFPQDRDNKLRYLASTINSIQPVAFSVAYDREPFDQIKEQATRRAFRTEYFWAFHSAVVHLTGELKRRGLTQRFELYFDENSSVGRRAKKWYPLTFSLCPQEYQAIMPVEPLFRDDKDVLPLQAADLYAWMTRARLSGGANEFEWLETAFPNVTVADGSRHYKKDDIKAMAQAAKELDPEERAALDRQAAGIDD